MRADEIKRQVSIEKLLIELGSTETHGKWRCLFPQNHTHGDQHPSVDIYQGERAFCRSQNCFGPKGADIFQIVGLVNRLDTFPDQKSWIEQTFGLANGTPPKPNILRVYEWTDAEGRKAYHLRTNDPHHKFTWNQKPDGTGAWTLKPCTPDLYQRDRVKEATSVIVCAGERDCDTLNGWLRELGMYPESVATTPYSGESSVKADMFTLVHGKKTVFVLGDNDQTGEAYREKVLEFLRGKVGSLYPLWVPTEFNDVTEWAEAGATPEDFQEWLEKGKSSSQENHPSRNEDESRQNSIEAEIDRLASLSLLDYTKTRGEASKRLGIGLTLLGELVKAKRREQGKGKTLQGKEIVFEDVLPATEPVDGAALLENIVRLFNRYLVLPNGADVAMALWVLRTHAFDVFGVNPRLAFLSPEKGCGKTTALDLLSRITPRPLLVSNITPSAIFRVIEKVTPTLILDEMDSFQGADEELRGILNSGHARTAAQVIRGVGDSYEPRAFSTWCPMIFAAIGSLPDTLESRSIIIRIQRKKPTDKVERLIQRVKDSPAFKEALDTISRQCVRWVQDHITLLSEANPDIIECLPERANDNWSGLLAIAELCGENWLEKAKSAALMLAGKEATSDTIGEKLLADIKGIFEKLPTDRISSEVLCKALGNLEERPWGTWSKGHPITPLKVAALLDKYEIKSQTIREGGGTCKGYYRAHFEDAWERYLPFSAEIQNSKCYNVTNRMNTEETPNFQNVTDGPCDVSKNGTIANTGTGCDAVTFQNRWEGEKQENESDFPTLFDHELKEVAFDLDA